MKPLLFTTTVMIMLLGGACAPKEDKDSAVAPAVKHVSKVDKSKDITALKSNYTYVPAYSQVHSMNSEEESAYVNLSITLSVRNTDMEHGLIIKSVKYFNNAGELVKDYISEPIEISAMGSESYFVPAKDRSGGIGANFLIEWTSEQDVNTPYIEALMFGGYGNYGYSWSSMGQIVTR